MLSKLCLLACACMLCMLHTPISAQPLPLGVAQIKFDNIRYDIQPDDWIKYAKPAFFELKEINNQAGGNPEIVTAYSRQVSQSVTFSTTSTVQHAVTVEAEFGTCFICPVKTKVAYNHQWGSSTTKGTVTTSTETFSVNSKLTLTQAGCVQSLGWVEYVDNLQVPYTMYVRYYQVPGGTPVRLPTPLIQPTVKMPDITIEQFAGIVRDITNKDAVVGTGRDTEGSFVRVALKGVMTVGMGVKANIKTCPCGLTVPACMAYVARSGTRG